jgi:hypothetical protein
MDLCTEVIALLKDYAARFEQQAQRSSVAVSLCEVSG